MIGKVPASAKSWLIGSVLASILVIYGLVGQYWLVSRALHGPLSSRIGMLFGFLLLLRFFLLNWQRRISGQTAMKVKEHYRFALLEKLGRIHPGQMTSALRGKLNYLFGEGIEVLDLYWGLFVPQFFTGLLGPLAVCIIIALIDPLIGGILALLIPLIPLVLMLVFRRFSWVSQVYQGNLASLTEQFTQSLYGLPLLKLYGASETWGRKMERQGGELRDSTMDLLKTNQLVILLVDLLFSLGTMIAASVLSLWRYQQGVLSVADSAFIILSSIELIRPLSLMGAFFFAGALGREVQKDVGLFLGLEEVELRSRMPMTGQSLITIDHLDFAYPDKPPLFSNFEFEVNQGEWLCITGQSGIGKSTLLQLILGHLKPQSGKILLAEEQISSVQQSPYIFHLSLEENLRFQKPEGDDPELSRVLHKLGLEEWIRQGRVKEILAENGQSISGGEALRIGLSRALLSDSRIYLIDEPTSKLDRDSERKVIVALEELKQRGAVVCASHSQNIMQAADRTIVLTGSDSIVGKEAVLI